MKRSNTRAVATGVGTVRSLKSNGKPG